MRALTQRGLPGEEGLEHRRRPASGRELGALPLEEQPGEERAVGVDRASNRQLRDGKMPWSAMQKLMVVYGLMIDSGWLPPAMPELNAAMPTSPVSFA